MTQEARLAPMEGPVSLTDRVHHLLRQAILSLELEPGAMLAEEMLAKQLGVSKTPVRSAIHRLAEEGLVVKEPYKGVFVAEVSLEKMHSILQVRAVLEGLAARLAATTFTPQDIAASERLLEKSEQALASGDPESCTHWGKEFHLLVHARSQNRYLQSMLQNVDAHLQRYRLYLAKIPGRMSKSIQEHRGVLDALRARDPDLAELTLRTHLMTLVEDSHPPDEKVAADGHPPD